MADDSQENDNTVFREIAAHLRANTAAFLVTNTVIAFIVVFVLRDVVPPMWLAVWCAMVTAWNIGRFMLVVRTAEPPQTEERAKKWITGFGLGAAVAGLIWGVGFAIFFPSSSTPHQVFLAFILGGFVAGTVSNYASHLPVFFSYAFAMLVPITVRFFVEAHEISFIMGGTLVLFLATISVVAVNFHRSVHRSIQLTIDNRKQVADLLRSQERYDLVLRGANDGIWDWDLRSNRVYDSPRLLEMFGSVGLEAEDTPEKFLETVHPEDREGYRKAMIAHLKGETDFLDYEFRIAGTEGENARWMLNRGLALRDANGRAYRMAGSITDITARKKADWALRNANERLENEVRARTHELSQNQERLSSILSAAQDGIALIEVDGTILEINDSAAHDLGQTRQDMIGKNFFNFLSSEISDAAQKRRDSFQHTADPQVFLSEQNGRWFEINVQPIFDDNGKVYRRSIIARDITRRRELEQQLAASQKIEALGQVAGGVAHEFNNLLQAVVGYLELMQSMTDDDEELDEIAGRALQIALGGQNLTQGLLSYVGKGRVQPYVIDTHEFVREFFETVPRLLGERYRVVTSLADDVWPVHVDISQLQASLLNLATNARDAMPEGGTLTVEAANTTLSAADAAKRREPVDPGDYVRISVTDTGSGMPPDVVAQMFDPFFTTKPPGEGTGLGLSMVFGFIRHQSGGFVDVDSTPDKGSKISIYLPKSEREEETILFDRPAVPETARKVLVVEDNLAVLDSTKTNLEKMGHKVIGAENGDSALTILASDPDIDILITDVIMPGRTNGIALAASARDSHPDIKVILMTGYDEKEVAANTTLPADRQVLQKPFRPTDLREAIAKLYTASA